MSENHPYPEMLASLERLAKALDIAHMRSFGPRDLVAFYELDEETFNKLDNIHTRILALDEEVLQFIEDFAQNP